MSERSERRAEAKQDDTEGKTIVVQITDGAENANAQLKRAWRRQANATGRCPVCAATLRPPNRAERRAMKRGIPAGFVPVTMMHEAGCPVGDGPLR